MKMNVIGLVPRPHLHIEHHIAAADVLPVPQHHLSLDVGHAALQARPAGGVLC